MKLTPEKKLKSKLTLRQKYKMKQNSSFKNNLIDSFKKLHKANNLIEADKQIDDLITKTSTLKDDNQNELHDILNAIEKIKKVIETNQ